MMDDLFTLADLKDQLGKLQQARWSGSLSVTYRANGVERVVQFRRDQELAAAIADLEQRIAELEGKGRPLNVVVRGRRGWVTP
jgi:hypothetical protein